ncbi:MAG: hypothetical protein ACI3V0_08755 [Faecousia sp.]
MDYQKKLQKRLYLAIGYCISGLIMVGISYFNGFSNSFLFPFGVAMMVCGVTRLAKYFKITRNQETMHKMEMAEKDERYLMIANKARSWAFSLYIIIAGVAVITMNLLGFSEAALPYAWSICALVAIYWVSWMILEKKY